MNVYVVFDPLKEEIISVHKNEDSAIKRCEEKDLENNNRREAIDFTKLYLHEHCEFKLED